MDTKLFDRDAALGMTQLFHYDPIEDTFTIETIQDTTAIVEGNKAEYNSIDERAQYGEFSKIASIPLNLFYDLQKRGITRDKAKFRAWLNDPDNRYFRTRPGRV